MLTRVEDVHWAQILMLACVKSSVLLDMEESMHRFCVNLVGTRRSASLRCELSSLESNSECTPLRLRLHPGL